MDGQEITWHPSLYPLAGPPHPQNLHRLCSASSLFLKNYLFLFTYLAVPGPTCGTRGLPSSLWHTGPLAAQCELLVMACGTKFPDQGSNPGPLHSEHRVLATEPPGTSPPLLLLSCSTQASGPTRLPLGTQHRSVHSHITARTPFRQTSARFSLGPAEEEDSRST